MRKPVLKIRKKVLDMQGVKRPCVQVQAIVDDQVRGVLEQDFKEVILFKRVLYSTGLPKGIVQPEPELALYLNNFVKNDACPEISVKSILAGQLYQAKDPWEVLCFEYIGKRAFDSLILVMRCAMEMGTETEYVAQDADETETGASAPDNLDAAA